MVQISIKIININNTPYLILLLEAGLSPIESIAMIIYLMYKHKLNNIGDDRLPNIALNSSQYHLRLQLGWVKDAAIWLNYWRIDETTTLQNLDNIKSIITSMFKEKMG